jgi:hypothetical protein
MTNIAARAISTTARRNLGVISSPPRALVH